MNRKTIWNKKAKILLGGVAVLGAGTLLLASVSAPLQVPALTVEPGTAVITLTQQGTSIYEKTLEITAPLDGEIGTVHVAEGQSVRKGEPIASLSATNVEYQIQRLENEIKGYEAQIVNLSLSEQKERDVLRGTRSELEGQLTSVQSQIKGRENEENTREAQIRLQESIVEQDRANLSIARRDLRNYREDYGSDTTDSEYNALRTALNNAEKSLSSSEQALLQMQTGTVEEGYYEGQQESITAQIQSIDNQLGKNYSSGMQAYYAAQIENARLNIAELAETQGKSIITAPYDCVIGALAAKEGESLSKGDPIATVGCNPTIEVLVPVREMDGISLGDTVELKVDKRAGEERSVGTVAEIDLQARVELSPLGVEESKIRVLIAPEESVAVGYQMDVEFTVYRQEDCLVVPKKALFQQDGQDCVWVIAGDGLELRTVVKGVETRSGCIINEGLEAGEPVILDANTQGLAAGKKVQAVYSQ